MPPSRPWTGCALEVLAPAVHRGLYPGLYRLGDIAIARHAAAGQIRRTAERADMTIASAALRQTMVDTQLKTVGVTDADIWDLLEMLGCDVAHVYFIAHPMSAAALEQIQDTGAGQWL